eukprot:4905749-Prymnesium_polylepis.1
MGRGSGAISRAGRTPACIGDSSLFRCRFVLSGRTLRSERTGRTCSLRQACAHEPLSDWA